MHINTQTATTGGISYTPDTKKTITIPKCKYKN